MSGHCPRYLLCSKGNACTKAHNSLEVHHHPLNYKTQKCRSRRSRLACLGGTRNFCPELHSDEEVEVDKIPDYESTSQSSVKDRYEAVAKTPDRGAKCLAQLSSISKNIESKTSSSLSLKVFVAESSKGEALKTRDKFALLTNIVKLAGSEATKSPSSRCETQSKKEKLLDSCVTGDSLAVDDVESASNLPGQKVTKLSTWERNYIEVTGRHPYQDYEVFYRFK